MFCYEFWYNKFLHWKIDGFDFCASLSVTKNQKQLFIFQTTAILKY